MVDVTAGSNKVYSARPRLPVLSVQVEHHSGMKGGRVVKFRVTLGKLTVDVVSLFCDWN